MSPTAVTYHHLEDINFWTSSTLNNILTIGNNLSSAGGGGGGAAPIWNRWGCSLEILNLTPKGDHLGVA